jgi:hypothetical protein
MKMLINKKSILGGFGVLVLSLICGMFTQTFAQNQQYAVQQAQQAVRDKIIRDKGGDVYFSTYTQAETYYISSSQTGVRGTGTWTRNNNSNAQDFSYEARVDNRKGKVDKINYKLLSDSNNGGKVPSWAVGTFYGRNPQNNGTIMLTINSAGNVTADFQGAASYGNFNNNRININGAESRVTRINNGIRTTRTDNGESIDYFINGNNNGGGVGGNVPSWAIGTFYGRNPQNSGEIALSISRDGSVTVNSDGSATYGTANNDRLTINGVSSRITRLNNGIRTTRIDNGERIDYYLNGNNNGGGNNNNGNAPSWAVGTFNARNPQNGGTITLTINSDGDVTVEMDGSVNYGTLDGDNLTINGITSKVKKTGNGIRTTRNDNGERIDYRRQGN